MDAETNAGKLVAAATAGGWRIDELPPGTVKMWNPERGWQDKCYRFSRGNSVIEAATLIGGNGHQHPDAFWLRNGPSSPVAVVYLYEMLGTLTTAADARGFATVPMKDPARKHRA
jgi:hypothetical protein